jgi:hypothetical protein
MSNPKPKPTLEEALAKSFGVPPECTARFSPDVIEYARFKASQVKKQYKLEQKRKAELNEAAPLLAKKSPPASSKAPPKAPSKKQRKTEQDDASPTLAKKNNLVRVPSKRFKKDGSSDSE